jgi:splicing factor 3A subunit 3
LVVPPFTGEEGFGRHLDLHELHLRFVNLKGSTKNDYYSFVESFYKFDERER